MYQSLEVFRKKLMLNSLVNIEKSGTDINIGREEEKRQKKTNT